jgi:hypothetical protein
MTGTKTSRAACFGSFGTNSFHAEPHFHGQIIGSPLDLPPLPGF